MKSEYRVACARCRVAHADAVGLSRIVLCARSGALVPAGVCAKQGTALQLQHQLQRDHRMAERKGHQTRWPKAGESRVLAWKRRMHRRIDLSQNRAGIPPSPTAGPSPPVIETRVPSPVIAIWIRAPPVMTMIVVHLSEIARLCLND